MGTNAAKAPGRPDGLRFYYVDEAGDPMLFNRNKQIVVGNEGCSRYFVLGLLDITDPVKLDIDINDLRKSLLADPYFKSVPSMQPERRKTALCFHAKDDLPEVRREVFSLLMRHEMRFFAVVRDKKRIAELVLAHNKSTPSYRYHPNQLYDRCVSRLFHNLLHEDDGYIVHFAKRGTRDRTEALQNTLDLVRSNSRRIWGLEQKAPIEITPTTPPQCVGLQAVDYFLWSLQRLLERGEDRFWNYVWPSVRLVHDVDDQRTNEDGVHYIQENPLTADCKKE